jgi:thiol:disulfide interchange protein
MRTIPSLFISAALAILGLAFSCAKPQAEPGIRWHSDLTAALDSAASVNKPVLIEFMAQWCPSCRAMDDSTFNRPEVVAKSASFIPVRVDVDSQNTVAGRYGATAKKYGGIGIPNFLFLDPAGRPLVHRVGFMNAPAFSSLMDSVLSGATAGQASAQ